MRDAFGGAFMIQIFLIFILIYICFTAMALNYAKAFKVKNAIIEYLESSEISNIEEVNANELTSLITYIETEILNKYNYNLSASNICNTTHPFIELINAENKKYGYCFNAGVVIEQTGEGINTEGIYYTVSTYVGWKMPFLNTLLMIGDKKQDVPAGLWKISGQTRLIVNE